MLRNILIHTVLLLAGASVLSAQPDYPFGFRNLPVATGRPVPAYTAVQDSSRFLWIGTGNGLMKYDGYRSAVYRFRQGDTTSLCHDHVNALLYCPEYGKMVAGTDAGVSVYDFGSDSFYTLKACGYRQVKSLLRDGDDLWIGTADGLFRFRTPGGLPSSDSEPEMILDLPSPYIACCRKIGTDLWFGSYDWVYRIGSGGKTEKFPIPYRGRYHNNLVIDISPDPASPSSGTILLGTEHGLIRYSPHDGTASMYLEDIPVKYFFRYSGDMTWIGTDNGLFITDNAGNFVRYSHLSGNSSSLPNNVVWSVFRDGQDNIFVCTDHGVSVAEISSGYFFRRVGGLSSDGDGMDVSVMAFDPDGNLWSGGMNGLIRERPGGRPGLWYKSDRGPSGMRLSHNKVRDLYNDGSAMWSVSDGGLDRIDYISGRVRHFNIMEPSGRYASNWMYNISEDRYGRLWLGTYSGVLVIDKARLLSSGDRAYIADRHYYSGSEPSISYNVVSGMAVTRDFVATLSGGSVDMISLQDGSVRYVALPEGVIAYTVESDGTSVWIGSSRGIFRLESDGTAVPVEGFAFPAEFIVPRESGIVAITDWGDLYAYDTVSGKWSRWPAVNNSIFCGAEAPDGKICLGAVDGYFALEPDRLRLRSGAGRPAVTALLLNSQRVEVGQEYGGHVILERNIGLTDRIVLKNGQNSFAFEFSAFDYTGSGVRYAYRLAGLDGSWQFTSDSRAVFINVPAGTYSFEVCTVTADGVPGAGRAVMQVRVKPVWYATTAAFVIYALLLAGVAVWITYFIRMRHQLQIEHIEREEALNAVKMKTEFFESVSHEFKSPLSIILGFVSRMRASEADAIRSKELQAVQRNAEKMHLLINQMLDYNKNGKDTIFIPAAVSLPEMAKEIFDSFTPAFTQKNISARFVSDSISYIFMLDRVKMESVFQNLLSNAVKFTPEGGTVLMSVTVGDQTSDMLYADVKVEDSGCGIREEELPFIFNQYYKAPSNQKYNEGGSGIGLHLTKEIVEMHKGKISVTSSPGKGTCFTVRLSTMKADSFIISSAQESASLSLHSLSKVWQHDRKPIILLVEDNGDIRDFITASLGRDYTFLLASEGRSALDMLETEKTDLVITDISMPGMDGLTMSRMIRRSVRTAFLPIIILTGKDDIQTQLQSVEYADAFISKPFDLNYLNSVVIRLLIKHEHYWEKIKQQQMLSPQTEEVESPDGILLREIVDIVNRHIADPELSVSVLSEESHYGSKQIYRKIKQLTGMSVVEFIRDIRLQKAASYLSQKKLTVSEVMYMVGFTTASYFAKCFKAKYGVSPSDYQDVRTDEAPVPAGDTE